MVDAGGVFFRVMGDHHEGLAGSAADPVQQGLDAAALRLVQAVQGFVEDVQGRILDEGAGQQA